MIFTPSVPMSDLVHENYLLLPIINRFGISLGFGSKTVDEVCAAYGLNTDFFLEVVNAYNNKDFFPEKNLRSFSIKLIVDYLQSTHTYFMNVKVPQIGEQIEELLSATSAENKEKVFLIKKLFAEYQEELRVHTKQEDDNVYPYSIEVEKQYLSGTPDEGFLARMASDSIQKYAKEHSNIDEKLYDLKNIIIKYLPPLADTNRQNLVLYELFNLENELHAHGIIEDKVLVPKVSLLEKKVAQLSNSK